MRSRMAVFTRRGPTGSVPATMNVNHLLEEYDLTLDDVRWYLSVQEAERLLSFKEHPHELAREIWSGQLEAAIYNMEERYLEELTERLSQGITSEQRVRELFGEIRAAKRRRPR